MWVYQNYSFFFFFDCFNGATRKDYCHFKDYGYPKKEPLTHRAESVEREHIGDQCDKTFGWGKGWEKKKKGEQVTIGGLIQ
jgi:hypothetical protein